MFILIDSNSNVNNMIELMSIDSYDGVRLFYWIIIYNLYSSRLVIMYNMLISSISIMDL
jgi:hypothetical protein